MHTGAAPLHPPGCFSLAPSPLQPGHHDVIQSLKFDNTSFLKQQPLQAGPVHPRKEKLFGAEMVSGWQ